MYREKEWLELVITGECGEDLRLLLPPAHRQLGLLWKVFFIFCNHFLCSRFIKLKTANIERNRVDLHSRVTAKKWKETSIVMSIFN